MPPTRLLTTESGLDWYPISVCNWIPCAVCADLVYPYPERDCGQGEGFQCLATIAMVRIRQYTEYLVMPSTVFVYLHYRARSPSVFKGPQLLIILPRV